MVKYVYKAVVAAIGAGATAALGIFASGSVPWDIATVIAAVCTTLAVYAVPNEQKPQTGAGG